MPFSLIEKFVVPFDWSSIKLFTDALLVSLMTKADAVAWLRILKLESVVVSARTNWIFLPSVVVIELPRSYAD